MKVSERLEKIPPYLFAEIDRKIAEAKAKGFDIISLGIGDPDTPTLAPVVEEMHKAIDNPKNHEILNDKDKKFAYDSRRIVALLLMIFPLIFLIASFFIKGQAVFTPAN